MEDLEEDLKNHVRFNLCWNVTSLLQIWNITNITFLQFAKIIDHLSCWSRASRSLKMSMLVLFGKLKRQGSFDVFSFINILTNDQYLHYVKYHVYWKLLFSAKIINRNHNEAPTRNRKTLFWVPKSFLFEQTNNFRWNSMVFCCNTGLSMLNYVPHVHFALLPPCAYVT